MIRKEKLKNRVWNSLIDIKRFHCSNIVRNKAAEILEKNDTFHSFNAEKAVRTFINENPV